MTFKIRLILELNIRKNVKTCVRNVIVTQHQPLIPSCLTRGLSENNTLYCIVWHWITLHYIVLYLCCIVLYGRLADMWSYKFRVTAPSQVGGWVIWNKWILRVAWWRIVGDIFESTIRMGRGWLDGEGGIMFMVLLMSRMVSGWKIYTLLISLK